MHGLDKLWMKFCLQIIEHLFSLNKVIWCQIRTLCCNYRSNYRVIIHDSMATNAIFANRFDGNNCSQMSRLIITSHHRLVYYFHAVNFTNLWSNLIVRHSIWSRLHAMKLHRILFYFPPFFESGHSCSNNC